MTEDSGALTAAELSTADALGTQLFGFLRLAAKVKARMSTMAPGSLEYAAFPIIAMLVREGPCRTSAVAEALHTEISTISRQTSALVHQGLIERQADPYDGRACLLAPTDAGRDLFERARTERNQWLASTLRDWDPADVDMLITLLTRLNVDLAEDLTPQLANQLSQGETV